MRTMYKPGGMFEFQGVMLDSKNVPDDQIEQHEKDGWGCAWSFLDDSLPDGGEYEREVRKKIKALGGKPAGRSSIPTLEKQLAELEAGEHGD